MRDRKTEHRADIDAATSARNPLLRLNSYTQKRWKRVLPGLNECCGPY
jgi:hypothetical protein